VKVNDIIDKAVLHASQDKKQALPQKQEAKKLPGGLDYINP
jgi:hypothetical protein